MYVCVYVCMCMYHGSAEDIRTRFSKLLKSDVYTGKRDMYIGLAYGKNSICVKLNDLYFSFRIFENLPGDFFSIDSTTYVEPK